MEEQHRRNDLTYGAALGAAEHEAGVGSSGRRNGQKIVVMSQNDSLLAPGKFQMLFIARPNQLDIDWHCHIAASATKTVGNCRIDVLVEMELERHILSGMRELRPQLGRILLPQRLREVLGLLHLRIDQLTMSVVVAERPVDTG